MKKIKGHFWSPSTRPTRPTRPIRQTRACALAVRFGALDPEGSLSGNERHSPSILYHQKIKIVFNFPKEILLRIFVFNFNKEIPLKFKNRSCLQFYKRNPFKNFLPSIY